MKTPDLTPAQIVAALGTLVGMLVSQGLVTNHTEKIIVGIAVLAIFLVLVLADALIRHGRAKVLAASIAAGTPQPPTSA